MVDMKKVGKPTFVSLILYPVVILIAGIVIVINGLITFCGFFVWSIFHPKQARDKVMKMTHSWLGRW
jgi:hypothetical protein